MGSHFVYILHSQKLNRFYTGYTSDMGSRMDFHRDAESRKFTSNSDDWTVFLVISCICKKQALSIEQHIKRMKSKTYIQNLAQYPEMRDKLLQKYKSDC